MYSHEDIVIVICWAHYMTWSLLIGGAGLMLRHRELLLPFRCAQIPTYSSRSGSLLWTIWLDMDNLWHRCVIWKRPTSNRSSCFHSTDVSNRLEAGPKPSRVPLLTSDLQDGSRQYVRQLSDCLLNSFAVYHSLFFHIITSQCIFFHPNCMTFLKHHAFPWMN